MALFPAYSASAKNAEKESASAENTKEEVSRPAWLNIESFPVNLADIPLPSEPQRVHDESGSSTEVPDVEVLSVDTKKNKHHKKKDKLKDYKRVKTVNESVQKEFFEDKNSVRGYLTVKTLTRPLVPQYYTKFRIMENISYQFKKKRKTKRYFMQVLEPNEETADLENCKKSTDSDNNWQNFHLEEELSKRTADFNKTLTEEPNNIDIWLEYVKFQDVVQQFEQMYRRGGSAKSLRVTTERKISILDKALTDNPQNERLLQERFCNAERLYPADTLAQQLLQMVEKSPGSIVLWRAYIRVTQGSLSLCNTTAVMKLYEKGMKKFHQLRRGAPSVTVFPMESGILDLLLECGLYLRQAGLWEQLWTLLRIYLELNLAQPDSDLFKSSISVPEDLITDLEETVLNSQLPLPELWYRIEKLREAAHWLPWSSEVECEDPQRLVFVDDVSDMLHPITSPKLSIRLALIVMTLLKIPCLPWRHTTMLSIGLHQVPSFLDGVEVLLTMYYPQHTLLLNDKTFLQGAINLVYGPQYLTSSWPGQEHYLEFVTKVFHSSAICLKEPARSAMFIWWLRFERFLVILDNIEHCKLPPQRKKKIKSSIKEFLKRDENRNNGLFYVEYALFEVAINQEESACKVLTTAVAAQGAAPVISIACNQKKGELCQLYRTLCEILLHSRKETDYDEKKRETKVLAVLAALVLGTPVTNWQSSVISTSEREVASNKFRHITTELLLEVSSELADGTEHLLPDFIVDWIACYGWWLLLTQSVWEAGVIFEEALQKYPSAKSPSTTPVLKSTCQREGIFESYVGLLYYYSKNNPGVYTVLQDVLHRGLQEFPNNLHLLSIIANIETTVGCNGSSWWKLTKYFQESNCLLAQIFQIFYMRYQGGLLQIATQQSYEFLNAGGPVVPDPSVKNRLSSLYNRLLNDSLTKRCSMLWRLYLRFLAEHRQDTSYHSIFYRAVEECPWVKVLYTEAVKLLPAELPQLQDLLIEKELRIHVTPDELDILRQDPSEVI
ncbi:CN102 protein [Gryllus bimaculatus]|nr:CN102 protein [Gryllus bimaculatus]